MKSRVSVTVHDSRYIYVWVNSMIYMLKADPKNAVGRSVGGSSRDGIETLEGDDLETLKSDSHGDAREDGANRLSGGEVVVVDGEEVGVGGVERRQDLFDGPTHGRDVEAPS